MFADVVLESFAKFKENSVLESLFNKVAGIKIARHKSFPMKYYF